MRQERLLEIDVHALTEASATAVCPRKTTTLAVVVAVAE